MWRVPITTGRCVVRACDSIPLSDKLSRGIVFPSFVCSPPTRKVGFRTDSDKKEGEPMSAADTGMLYLCAAAGPGHGSSRRPRKVRGRKPLTVDIHCHISTPECEPLV